MPSRRALLAAVAALAGCPESQVATPTPTPTATPTTTPYPETVAEALGKSRFEWDPPCPASVPCYHRISKGATPETVVVPDRERLSPESPEATLTTYNLADEPLVLGDPVRTYKWTDIRWSPTYPVDAPSDVLVVEPGASVERTVAATDRTDGRYAVVEFGYFGSPRDPPTVRPDPALPRRLAGEFFRFGAQFEVEGSDWWPTPGDVPTERDGETLVVHPDRDGDRRLVLEASGQTEGLPLVPETVAAHPPTRDAVLSLAREGVDRVALPTAGTARWYLEEGLIFPKDLHPELTVRLGDVLFTARVE